VRDEKGEIYTVRYEAVNAMLLNEFLKEHKRVKELQGTVARLAAQLNEQAAQIQKIDQRTNSKAPVMTVADR
jgi:chromosome segregation ATPase